MENIHRNRHWELGVSSSEHSKHWVSFVNHQTEPPSPLEPPSRARELESPSRALGVGLQRVGVREHSGLRVEEHKSKEKREKSPLNCSWEIRELGEKRLGREKGDREKKRNGCFFYIYRAQNRPQQRSVMSSSPVKRRRFTVARFLIFHEIFRRKKNRSVLVRVGRFYWTLNLGFFKP